MKDPDLPLEGRCRCGDVHLRITRPPLFTSACHCKGCQRMSAGAYSLSAAIPAEGFAVVAGDPREGGMPGSGHRFCPRCLSWLFTRIPGVDLFVNVRPTMFDDTRWYAPFLETCTSEALPFAATGAAHAFPRFPPMDTLGDLVAAYAHAVDRK